MPILTIKDNNFSPWGVDPDPSKMTGSSVKKQTERIQPKLDHRKLSLPNGIPQVLVTDKKVTMTYKDNGMGVDENGLVLKGKMHLATDISNIRINGFWIMNTELLTCLPSTIYTPMPVLKYDTPPFAQTVARLATMF